MDTCHASPVRFNELTIHAQVDMYKFLHLISQHELMKKKYMRMVNLSTYDMCILFKLGHVQLHWIIGVD